VLKLPYLRGIRPDPEGRPLMLAGLVLSHVLLGGVALASAFLARRARSVVLGAVAVVGSVLGLSLALSGAAPVWRTAVAEPGSALVAGVAVTLAWLLFWAPDLGGGRWWAAAAVGVC
jgi:hypothetical protein